jgi:NADH-quinone oxidoreductase subunit H
MSWPRALHAFARFAPFARRSPSVAAIPAVPWAPLAVVLVFVALVAAACFADRAPTLELIRVADVTPRDVELGEPLTIAGDGFPPGQTARVTFRGTLYRPGEPPQPGAEIVASGAVAAPTRIDVPFGEGLEALFCRAGDRAIHTTFEGDLEVAFRAVSPGQPPVAGVLRNVALDVRPLSRPGDTGRVREGESVLAFWGVHAAPIARESGLYVDGVDVGSRAAAAGIAPGDVVVRVDRVRVGGVADVVPAADAIEATVAVRHAGTGDETVHTLAVGGWRAAPPSVFRGSIFLVVVALAVALFFGAPGPSGVDAALYPLVQRLRRIRGSTAARPAGRISRTSALRPLLPPAGLPAVPEAFAAAALAVLPFSQYAAAARLDVGVLFVVAAATLAVAALVAAAAAGSSGRGLRAALHVAWQHAPAALAVAGVVLVAGSLRVQEIERTQGGVPWEWLAFRSPASLLSFALFAAALRVGPEARAPSRTAVLALVSDADAIFAQAARGAERGSWVDAGRRVHRLLLAGLAAALFLGGWSLPGVSPAQQDARPALELVGAIAFMTKIAAIVVSAGWAQEVLPARRLADVSRGVTPWQLAFSLAATIATAGWSSWAAARTVQVLLSPALVLVTAVALAALAHRVRHGLRSPSADGHVSPFL